MYDASLNEQEKRQAQCVKDLLKNWCEFVKEEESNEYEINYICDDYEIKGKVTNHKFNGIFIDTHTKKAYSVIGAYPKWLYERGE